ncbi:MAG TPA: DnaD domain protein [Anaerolineales bacterium]
MSAFRGFPEGKVHLTPIPGPFFTELLPEINHLGELKVTVYAFWRLDRLEGTFRYLRRGDFLKDAIFMQGLGSTRPEAEVALDDSLERAVLRGALLKATLNLESGEERLYFLNSPKGRAAVQAITRGQWQPFEDGSVIAELIPDPPNIYRLYEEHIGPLTPLIADALSDAENIYPAQWIEDAFRKAVENNKRNWRYIEAILRRWQEGGRDDRPDRRDTEKARRRYAEWENPDQSE